MDQVAIFLGPQAIVNLTAFFVWLRELETDNGGLYYLVASIVINFGAWNFGLKPLCNLFANLVAQYIFFWLNWFYIPVNFLCHLVFFGLFYWQSVMRLQKLAVKKMQQHIVQSRTLVIVGSVVGILVSYFCYAQIYYAPLFVWRIFFADSDLGYNLRDESTPASISYIFAWLSWASSTAYSTLFFNIPAIDYVKMYFLKFAIYAAYASSPLILLAFFAFWHRFALDALGAGTQASVQPYYYLFGDTVPLMFAQFSYPFSEWPLGGVRGVGLIILFGIIFLKYFHNQA